LQALDDQPNGGGQIIRVRALSDSLPADIPLMGVSVSDYKHTTRSR
jgi:hypothetical protein